MSQELCLRLLCLKNCVSGFVSQELCRSNYVSGIVSQQLCRRNCVAGAVSQEIVSQELFYFIFSSLLVKTITSSFEVGFRRVRYRWKAL